MASGEIEVPALDIQAVSPEERARMIDEALHAGHMALRCAPLILGEQHLTVQPDSGEQVNFWFEEYVTVKDEEALEPSYQIVPVTGLIKGLAYEGFFRRTGHFRRYRHHDAAADELRHGDKVALRVPGGELFKSAKIRELRLAVAEEAPQVAVRTQPEPAYS